ncbi:hypothetical protein LPB67_07840 [Undibacterium sp. Jales W-56]|uniref:hypothetical protein n=1 Tax=Undibacterium sp. Jales W-56 TaxID=2897325 RepID=UPI0021D1AF94|nr:hypothetical protein [Undibacterium sp. Jales W-56]MCU6433689.1 hypothetical protein [Undibacterium sp. Jales W-56]
MAYALGGGVVGPAAFQVAFMTGGHAVDGVKFDTGEFAEGALVRAGLFPGAANRVYVVMRPSEIGVAQVGLAAECVVRDGDEVAIRVDSAGEVAERVVTKIVVTSMGVDDVDDTA